MVFVYKNQKNLLEYIYTDMWVNIRLYLSYEKYEHSEREGQTDRNTERQTDKQKKKQIDK